MNEPSSCKNDITDVEQARQQLIEKYRKIADEHIQKISTETSAYSRVKSDQSLKASSIYNDALEHEKEKHYEAAYLLYKEIIDKYPGSVEAGYAKTKLHLKEKKQNIKIGVSACANPHINGIVNGIQNKTIAKVSGADLKTFGGGGMNTQIETIAKATGAQLKTYSGLGFTAEEWSKGRYLEITKVTYSFDNFDVFAELSDKNDELIRRTIIEQHRPVTMVYSDGGLLSKAQVKAIVKNAHHPSIHDEENGVTAIKFFVDNKTYETECEDDIF